MKTVKFYDIPALINDNNVVLEYDGDPTDLRLHSEARFSWGAKTKKEYLKAAKRIDKIEYKGKGWTVYASYDVSSYEYWMKQMQEQNYINISVMFDAEEIEETELGALYNGFDNAFEDAEAIESEYSYNPSPYDCMQK